MSNTGTNEAEQSLNTPKSEQELAEQVLTAVSEGDDKELDRLFEVELTPDVEASVEEDSEDSSVDDGQGTNSQASDDEAVEAPAPQGPTAEEKLAALEQQLANAQAAVGRMASMQSRLAKLEHQLKQKAAVQAPPVDDTDKQLDDRIAKLAEIDPDTAEILKALKTKQPKPQPQQEADDGFDERLHEEYYKVLATHADADKIFAHPAWHAWKSHLTPEQRQWAESSDSSQVIVALGEFKKYMSGAVAPVQAPQEDATKAARDKKLQTSTSSSDAPVKTTKPFDENAFFYDAYAKIAKEAGIVY